MNDEWKNIPGTNGKYKVSNAGKVKNTVSDKELKPRPTHNGYDRVYISIDGKRQDKYIHRLVADAFCTHSDEQCDVVNHIDNDTHNNVASNLEWVTQRKNVHYAMEQGRVKNFPNAKRLIGIKDGEHFHFSSSREAEKVTKLDHKTILRACNNPNCMCGGYHWMFSEVT